jgi:hypothetical protein
MMCVSSSALSTLNRITTCEMDDMWCGAKPANWGPDALDASHPTHGIHVDESPGRYPYYLFSLNYASRKVAARLKICASDTDKC